VVTHNVSKIEFYSDQILSLKNGLLNTYDRSLINIQKYQFCFLAEQDVINSQVELGVDDIKKESEKVLIVAFNSAYLPINIKSLAQ
jgi:hypothetical protein